MQLYKNFFKLVKANRISVTIAVIIMVVYAVSMIISAPYIIDKNEASAEEKSADYKNLVVIFRDNDGSELSSGVRKLIESYGSVEEDTTSSEESINDILYFSIADFYIEVPENFQTRIDAGEKVELTYSSHSQISGKTFSFVNDIDSFVNIYRNYRAMGMESAPSVEKALSTTISEVTFGVVTEKKESLHTDAREYATYMILNYFCFVCLWVLGMSVAAVIIAGNRKEIAQRIDASPIRPGKKTWAQMGGLMTCAAFLVIIYTIFGFVYAGSSDMMSKYGWVAVLNLITTTFYICGFTLLVSSFRLNNGTLSLICNSVGLSMSFLCGIFVPFYLMSSSVQTFAHFLPFFWSGKVLNTIYAGSGMNYTFSVGNIFASLGVQILFGLVFIMISMIIKKVRQGKAA
ncbi:MAG: ABC transporter permease [Clostridiales bacterium]|nr:ABC transporter permease [Clostridiales bacterium]